jgi:hypothetical protein
MQIQTHPVDNAFKADFIPIPTQDQRNVPEDLRSNGQRRWNAVETALLSNFDKPDTEAAQILFATIAAHRIIDHSPAWNMLIAPSGSMKTALLDTLQDLPSVYTLDDVTENTFISGMLDSSRSKPKTLKEGMRLEPAKKPIPASFLNRIGEEGILVIPDFSTVLAMNKNKQPVILSQLRRIYDGSFAREFGTAENLNDRKWRGRITLLAGVTPEFDRAHTVFQSLGERFVRTRWPRAGGVEAALCAMHQKTTMAIAMREVVHDFLSPVLNEKTVLAPQMKEADELRLANLGEFIVLARAFVSRERATHEIEDAPDPEGNTRFPQQLAQIGRGWAVLIGSGVVTEEGMKLIFRVGFDCIPPRRCEVLRALMEGKSAYALGMPHSIVDRAIEDLQAVGLVTKDNGRAKLSTLAIHHLTGAKLNGPHASSPQFLWESGMEKGGV